jgi:hypothetical protein
VWYNIDVLTTILIAFSTLLILLLMAGTFAFFYFRSLLAELNEYWLLVLDDLSLRLDKIPNLLETVKSLTSGEEKLISQIIELRGQSRPMEKADAAKVRGELAVSQQLRVVWSLPKQFPELNRDTNFLALKTEFKELNGEIEKSADEYNQRVRKYNKTAGLIFLRPVAAVFRFDAKQVFEYET